MKKLIAPLFGVVLFFVGCIGDKPFATSKGTFKLKSNTPVIDCTLIEEGEEVKAHRVCFSHEGYEEREYKDRTYSSNEGGIHIWVRTFSDETQRMTSFKDAINLTKTTEIEIVKKCGSKFFAPDDMMGEKFIWLKVTGTNGAVTEYLAPASTVIWFKKTDGEPGSTSLVAIEKITNITEVPQAAVPY